MLNIVHYLRYIWYTRRYGGWFYSRLQVIGCHYIDSFSHFLILLVTTVEIEAGALLILGKYAKNQTNGMDNKL
jgi:hypothetical protein